MTAVSPAATRLDFTLPTFCRVAWVSDHARAAWEPVLHALARARPRIFAHAVRSGLYRCALLEVSADEKTDLGLATAVLGEAIVIGEKEAVDAFVAARREQNHDAEWDLVSAPSCCRAFLKGHADTTLARALRTAGAELVDRTVRVPAPGLLNTLWSSLGIRLLSHDPCSMSCSPSRRLAAAWIEAGRDHGFASEMDRLEELLSWPVEWSALHGIAEIRTPILKISTNTDATAETHKVQLLSEHQPREGLPGLRFPYRQRPITRPASRPDAAPVNPRIGGAPLQPHPRSSAILDETFERIRRQLGGELPPVESIHLSNYFNIVRLADRSTGAAMNYCRFKSDSAVERARASLEARLPADPSLLSYLFEEGEPDLLQLSLKTCLVGALSKKLLLQPEGFEVQSQFDPGFLPDARRAVVVGFGGYMDYIILRTSTPRVHVSDLQYRTSAARMDRRLAHYRKLFPEKTITISDGSDNTERLAEADLISITGSAFCTGTMEGLLDASRDSLTVIVQGQSAACYPEVLFEKGVTLISTTLKPDDLIDVARTDDEKLRALLEGKLPPFYIRPAGLTCQPAPHPATA